jgi:DNA-binding GntR family transcriptional regulator
MRAGNRRPIELRLCRERGRDRKIVTNMKSSSLPKPRTSRRSSGDAAAQYIRTLIFDGYLRPGARVPQDDVAQALGISRIPVREALVALGQQGWVTIEPNRGAFVASLDERAVRDHYELYGLLYGFAAKKALERSGDTLGEKLGQLADDFSKTVDPAEAQRIALAFHAAVVQAACSPRIDVAVRAPSALVPANFYEFVPTAMKRQRAGFSAVARACRRGDGQQAADEYTKMMRGVAGEVVRLFRRRGLFSSSDD